MKSNVSIILIPWKFDSFIVQLFVEWSLWDQNKRRLFRNCCMNLSNKILYSGDNYAIVALYTEAITYSDFSIPHKR